MKSISILVLISLTLSGCISWRDTTVISPESALEKSKSQKNSAPGNKVRRFESAIARKLLGETHRELKHLKGSTRVNFLRHQSARFNRSVDRAVLSQQLKTEVEIFDYLVQSEELRWFGTNFFDRLKSMTSLDWPISRYEAEVMAELGRIDQTIAALNARDPLNGFSLQQHMAEVRQTAKYPLDSASGRQTYLDSLADAMLSAQLDWNDIFHDYEPSELGIFGSDDAEYSFRHAGNNLYINLADVRDLPHFELKSLALFFGFPGLQAFHSSARTESLRNELTLPAYTLGWASFMLNYVATRDTGETTNHLYFQKLISSLALADLRTATGEWQLEDAVSFLKTETPYAENRIRLMLNQLDLEPGYYLAGFGGYVYFSDLRDKCLATGNPCEAAFFQQIIESGPVPFHLLERRLTGLGLLPVQ